MGEHFDRIASASLRPASADDEPFLFELYAGTRAEELDAWGWNEAQREAFLRMQFRAQQQSYRMSYPGAEHGVIVLEGNPVGRVIVNRTEGELLIVDIALLPECRGSGIGTALIKDLLAEAAETDRRVRLHVLLTNAKARRLYERLGFSEVSDNGVFALMEWRRLGREERAERLS